MDLLKRSKRRSTSHRHEPSAQIPPSITSSSSSSHRHHGLDVHGSVTQPRVRSHSPSQPHESFRRAVSRGVGVGGGGAKDGQDGGESFVDGVGDEESGFVRIHTHKSRRAPRARIESGPLSFVWRFLDFRNRRRLLALIALSIVAVVAVYATYKSSLPASSPRPRHDEPRAVERSVFAGVWDIHYSDGDSNKYTIDFDGNVDSASGDGEKSGRLLYVSATVFRLDGIYRAPSYEEIRVVEKDDTGATKLEITNFYRPMEKCCTAVATRIGLLQDVDSTNWAYVLLSNSKVGAKDVTATVIMRPPISVRNKPEIALLMKYFHGEAKLDVQGGPSDNHLARYANFKANRNFGEVITLSRAVANLEAHKEYSFSLRGVENPSKPGKARIFIECGVLLANITIPIVDDVPDRVVTIGDLHGDISKARRVLKWQGLANDDDHWIGGSTTLVQTGDLIDRGPYSLEVLNLFHQLRREAPDQGGHVELLLGNHEVMWLQNSWQYLHPDDKLRSQDLPDRVPKLVAGKHGSGSLTGGEAAEWMLTCGIAYARNDTVFVHGGISPEWAEKGIDGINEQFQRALLSDPNNAILSDSGPLWSRKFSTGEYHCEELRESLRLLDMKRMVVGHSIQYTGVPSKYCDGQVYAIDIAMSDYMSMEYKPDPAKMAVFEVLNGEPRILVYNDDEAANLKSNAGNEKVESGRRKRRNQKSGDG